MFQVSHVFPMAVPRTIAIALVLLCSALIPQVQAEANKTVHVGGSGFALGGMQLLAKAFMKSHPDAHVIVLPSLGSGGGIRALLAGKIDVAVSARPLKEAERAKGLIAWEYARTPIVFATHSDTAAEGVTLKGLAAIYAGETKLWPDGARLRLIMRPAAENDVKLLHALSPEMDKAVEAATQRQDLFVAINDQDNASALEDIRGSLGLTSLAQMLTEKRHLKALALDGVGGTMDALRDGTYAHAKSMYLASTPKPVALAAAFVHFVWSPEGRRILSASGHLVTDRPEKPNM